MNNRKFIDFFRDNLMLFVLIILVLVFTCIKGTTYLSYKNLVNVVNQNVAYLVVGVAITFIMLGGALDLSTGYQISTIAVVMGLMAKGGVSTPLILLSGIVLGVLLGMVNGVIYARLKVFPFIITLATQYVLYGVTYLLSDSKTFRDFSDAFNFMGGYKFSLFGTKFPISIIIMAVIVLIGAFILNWTYFGRNIYALGSNPDAVALSGVSVAKTRILVFAVAGVFIGLSTIMNIGRTGAASSGTGVGSEFTVMAGCMLGGIKMGGGGGKMKHMVYGVLIIGVLNNGMNIMNLDTYWQYIALGVVLLIAITVDTLQTEGVQKRAKLAVGSAPIAEDAACGTEE